MLYFLFKGGPVVIPLIIISIFGLAVIIDRLIVIRRVYRFNMEKFCDAVCRKIASGKLEDALNLSRQHKNQPIGAMFTSALENNELTRPSLEKMLERVGNHEVKKLEKRLGGLVSIVGIAPLLGFLGTITGLIRAFMAWEKAGNDVTVSSLASGIYEAMITSAIGLMIAIPYYLCYNYFISRIKYFAHELDDYAGQLLEAMSKAKFL
ncbi:MAG: MotA/TolQ/ExbB proton channel family protein [Candidatus Omnitrophota bacterium]